MHRTCKPDARALRRRAFNRIMLLSHRVTPPVASVEEKQRQDVRVARLVERFSGLAATAPTADTVEQITDQERERRALEFIGVPVRFQAIDLLQLEPELPAAYRSLAAELLALMDQPALVAVVGPVGTGKSALAAGLVREFWKAHRRAYRRNVSRLLSEIAEAPFEPKGSTPGKDQIRARYRDCDLLVLDEVDRRDAARVGAEGEFEDLLDWRYESLHSTVLISNLMPEAFKANIGLRLTRRIVETGGICEAAWGRIEGLRA